MQDKKMGCSSSKDHYKCVALIDVVDMSMVRDKTYLVSHMCRNAPKDDIERARAESSEVVVKDLCIFCANSSPH